MGGRATSENQLKLSINMRNFSPTPRAQQAVVLTALLAAVAVPVAVLAVVAVLAAVAVAVLAAVVVLRAALAAVVVLAAVAAAVLAAVLAAVAVLAEVAVAVVAPCWWRHRRSDRCGGAARCMTAPPGERQLAFGVWVATRTLNQRDDGVVVGGWGAARTNCIR